MKKIQTKEINLELLAQALGLTDSEEAYNFMNDGRIIGRLGEFWVDGKRQNENAPFDVKNEDGERIEVRSITKKVSFASSKEVGYGRTVTDKGFKEKLNSLDKYLLLDIRTLKEGRIDMIELNKSQLDELPIGKNKDMSAKKFYEIYDGNK
jgi:hypothetical protein